MMTEAARSAPDPAGQLAMIIGLTTEAIVAVDSHRKIQLLNPAAEKMFGYAAQEIQGRSLDLLVPEGDPPFHREEVDSTSTLAASGPGIPYPVVGVRKNGTQFRAEASNAVLEDGIRRTRILCLHDLTEQRHAEEKLERRDRAVATLCETSAKISARQNDDALLRMILDHAASALGATVGAIWLLRRDGQTVQLVASLNLPANDVVTVVEIGDSSLGSVIQLGQDLIVEDYGRWEPKFGMLPATGVQRVRGHGYAGRREVHRGAAGRRYRSGGQIR